MIRPLLLCLTLAFSECASAACEPVPYSIQAKELHGKIVFKMPTKFSDPTNLPKPTGINAGGAYIRSMYAAMGPTVIREVLLNYVCRFEEVVDNDAALSLENREAYKAAFQEAVNEIGDASAVFFPAFASNDFVQIQAIKPTIVKYPPLPSVARVPSKYLAQSIGVIADSSFLIQNSYEGYLSGSFNGIETTACGKFIRAALAENAGIVQHLAASMRTTLLTYFKNSDAGVKSAMSMLYMEASSAASVTAPTKAEGQSLAASCAA